MLGGDVQTRWKCEYSWSADNNTSTDFTIIAIVLQLFTYNVCRFTSFSKLPFLIALWL